MSDYQINWLVYKVYRIYVMLRHILAQQTHLYPCCDTTMINDNKHYDDVRRDVTFGIWHFIYFYLKVNIK